MKPEKVVEMVKESGLEITLEMAKAILEYLNTLANISIAVYLLKDPDS